MFGSLRAPTRSRLRALLTLFFLSILPAHAGDALWHPRQLDRSGFVLAAEGVAGDGTPLTLTVVPTRLDGGLQIHTTFLRGEQGLALWQTYHPEGMQFEARAGEERFRARLWPAHQGGFVVEYDLPDGRSFRMVADPEQGMLAGDVHQLAEALSGSTGVLRLLQQYRRDRAHLGPGALGAVDGPILPGWNTEIFGGTNSDRCVAECSIDCGDHCAFECALDPLVSCRVCTGACAVGCMIGCIPKKTPKHGGAEREFLD